jgi:hypothetical protein
MKNFIAISALLASSVVFAQFAADSKPTTPTSSATNQLIVTKLEAKGGTTIALDAILDGSVASMDFRIQTNLDANANIDLSGCVSGIKGRSASCFVKDGVIYGGFYSPDMSKLASGRVEIGRITLTGSSKGEPKVLSFEVTSNTGSELPSAVSE